MEFHHQFNHLLLQIGKRLSGIRHARNEKLLTVANALGISHGIISRIEHGRYSCLSIALLLKLANHYNIAISELFVSATDSAEA